MLFYFCFHELFCGGIMDFHSLSNTDLAICFEKLVRQERKITSLVLTCIAEVDRRRLYLEKGYYSLFDFLVKDFGYSPGAAMRRIDGARLLRELPSVAEKFETGALTLSQAHQIQRASREIKKSTTFHISTDEKKELILQIAHLSQRDSEKVIAKQLDLPSVPVQKETLHRDESVTLTLTFSPEQICTLEQARALASHATADGGWVETLTYLARKEISRRTGLKMSQGSATESHRTRSTQTHATPLPSSAKKNPQRLALPAKVRQMLLNTEASCEFTLDNGKRCGNRRFLQIDHICSVSRGGGNNLENLQVLCGAHNRYKYSRDVRIGTTRSVQKSKNNLRVLKRG